MTEFQEAQFPPTLASYAPKVSGAKINCAGGKKDQMPLVSVITIVRNGVGTFPRAMESVASQDFPNIEYIVIDGGSTDGTVEAIKRNEQKIGIWLSGADDGISDAFNKGIALANGEIIGLLNSDDWYEQGAVRAMVEWMQSQEADIGCGKMQYWDGDRRTFLVTSNPDLLMNGMTVGHPTVFVRRKCYRATGLFRTDFRLAMDYEWLLRAKVSGARFAVVDQCIANMQGGGIGDRRWRDSQREVGRARALHVQGADSPLRRRAYVASRIFVGTCRRFLDACGLGMVRRAYHRWLSPIEISSTHERKD